MMGREKKRLSKWIAVTFIAALLLPATHAAPPANNDESYAKDCSEPLPNNRRGGLPPRHGDHLFENFIGLQKRLHLTQSQIDAINKLNRNYLNKIDPISQKLRERLNTLHRLLQENDVSLKKIRNILEEISAHRVDILMLKIEHRLKADKILTEDQKNLLRKLKQR